jgi:cytochrome c oxidase cbb3-type subunit 3
MVRGAIVLFSAALAAAALTACERPPSADKLREWAPSDHDRAEEQSNQAAGSQQAPPGSSRTGNPGGDAGAAATLLAATWETNCLPCHGPNGHGDGPNGPMVNAPDLTRDDLQSKFTDEELVAIIKGGKNRMPKFDLPDPVVRGLVAGIRAMRGR